MRLLTKLVLVFIASAFLSHLNWKLEIRSPFILLWLFGIPAIFALFFKRTTVDRLALFTLLSLVSFIGIGFTAALIGYP